MDPTIPQPPQQPTQTFQAVYTTSGHDPGKGFSITGIILSLLFLQIPGLVFSVIGLIKSQKDNRRGTAGIIGIVLNALGIILFVPALLLLTFIALPSLQKNARDMARKQDVSQVSVAVQSYVSSHNGAFPDTSSLQSTHSSYTTAVSVVTAMPSKIPVQPGEVIVAQGFSCGQITGVYESPVLGNSLSQFVVMTWLEKDSGSVYCQSY